MSANGVADPDRGDRADDVLALAADVEQPAAEREGDGEPGEDERRRQQEQRLLEVRRCELIVFHGNQRAVRTDAVRADLKNQFSPVPSKIAW